MSKQKLRFGSARVKYLVSALAFGSVTAAVVPAYAWKLPPPSCHTVWDPNGVYHPAAYAGLAGGDAILLPVKGDATLASAMMSAVGMHSTHVALAYDSTGSNFVQSQWDGVAPPSTDSTGGAHACSRVIAVGYLQQLNPGTSGYAQADETDILSNALIFPAMGNGYCNTPADRYRFNSFFHDDTYGGSCEKYLADYCGVDVQPQDKFQLGNPALNADWLGFSNVGAQNGNLLNEGLLTVYNFAYDLTLGVAQQVSWLKLTFGCGGIDATILAQRASMQIVNEIRFKAQDMIQPWWAGCANSDTGCMEWDGDANLYTVTAPNGAVVQEQVGAGETNNQWSGPGYSSEPENNPWNSGYDYCMDVNQSNQPVGVNCASWLGRTASETDSWKPLSMNVPDDVANAAARQGKGPKATTITQPYYSGGWVTECNY